MVDEKLMDILACPECKTPVKEVDGWIVCCECRIKYPIRDDIPVMLTEEAQELEDEEVCE